MVFKSAFRLQVGSSRAWNLCVPKVVRNTYVVKRELSRGFRTQHTCLPKPGFLVLRVLWVYPTDWTCKLYEYPVNSKSYQTEIQTVLPTGNQGRSFLLREVTSIRVRKSQVKPIVCSRACAEDIIPTTCQGQDKRISQLHALGSIVPWHCRHVPGAEIERSTDLII